LESIFMCPALPLLIQVPQTYSPCMTVSSL
jgi:hypothetical protein